MKKGVKTWKHRAGQSVHEELKQGFEKWLRSLPEINQSPQNPTGAERKNEFPPVQPHRQMQDR